MADDPRRGEGLEKNQKKKRRASLPESERKRRKVQRSVLFHKSKIYLGAERERWATLKHELNLKTDRELGTILIDHYRKTSGQVLSKQSNPISSTPGPSKLPSLKDVVRTPSVSGISVSGSEVEQHQLSGFEEIDKSEDSNGQTLSRSHDVKKKYSKSGRPVVKKLSSSFMDPFDLSIDITTIENEEFDESDDPDYEPSFTIEAVLPSNIDQLAEDVAYEEAEFGLEIEEEDLDEEAEQEESTTSPIQSVLKITTAEQCVELSKSTKCIVDLNQLRKLPEIHVEKCSTDGCLKRPKMEEHFVGSALYLKWVCDDGHVSECWCSQPVLNKRLHSGDFLICATILTSGNNFGKLALWADMLHLRFPSADQFHRIQASYIIPTIETFWTDHQRELLNTFRNVQIIVLGDGRNDTPGYCAQYCSYTLMEKDTKKILTLKTLDKRMTERKSVNMEKIGFQAAMDDLEENGLTVCEVVTDAHLGIGALMKTKYPGIKHSHDIWHVAKNLGKKLIKLAQKKENAILLKWSKDIVNHFWFACKEAETYNQFMSIWRGVLHHVTNTHEWILPHGSGAYKCLHGPLPEEDREKKWLDPARDCKALKNLASVVLDKRMLGKVHYYLNFRSTADLEGFHQHILMYCAKRFAYTPPVYRARNLLAAIDHNMNLGRSTIVNKDGTVRLKRVWNKKSCRWSVYEVKEKKSYKYVDSIIQDALVLRINDRVGMRKKREMDVDDPRLIARHLAPVEPPPTKEIYASQVSRFK